jgi:glucosamine kinase
VISDEGSGAWLGCEAARRVLWAYDGRIEWSELLTVLFARFQSDPHAIVRWSSRAAPRDLAALAPLVVDFAMQGDSVAVELMQTGAGYIDALAKQLVSAAGGRLALMGGLAEHMEPFGWRLRPRACRHASSRLALSADDAWAAHPPWCRNFSKPLQPCGGRPSSYPNRWRSLWAIFVGAPQAWS